MAAQYCNHNHIPVHYHWKYRVREKRYSKCFRRMCIELFPSLTTEVVKYEDVEYHLDYRVDHLQQRGSLGVSDEWTECIEERLQEHPHQLAQCGAEETSLSLCRDVCVQLLISLVLGGTAARITLQTGQGLFLLYTL